MRQGPEGEVLRVALLDSIGEWGGGEKWCVQTAHELTRRGHEPSVACAAGSALAERACEVGVPVWTGRVGALGWSAGSARGLGRFLQSRRVEAVIANVGRDVRMGARACRSAGAALLQRRGLLRPIKNSARNRALYQRSVRRVIVNARAIGDCMRESGVVPGERFVVIPNGIDTHRPTTADGARLRAGVRIPADAPLVAVVGRLAPMKGHAVLLEAWREVLERLPRSRLLIVGDGELGGGLYDQAVRLGLAESVRFLGFRRDLDEIYAAMDLLVLPSLRDEGCNNALLEGMWHGRPAVVSACGGLPEVIEEGRTGKIVPIGDRGALAGAIVELLAGPDRCRAMGEAAREVIIERYSLERVTDQLEHLLLGLRGEHGP